MLLALQKGEAFVAGEGSEVCPMTRCSAVSLVPLCPPVRTWLPAVMLAPLVAGLPSCSECRWVAGWLVEVAYTQPSCQRSFVGVVASATGTALGPSALARSSANQHPLQLVSSPLTLQTNLWLCAKERSRRSTGLELPTGTGSGILARHVQALSYISLQPCWKLRGLSAYHWPWPCG